MYVCMYVCMYIYIYIYIYQADLVAIALVRFSRRCSPGFPTNNIPTKILPTKIV